MTETRHDHKIELAEMTMADEDSTTPIAETGSKALTAPAAPEANSAEAPPRGGNWLVWLGNCFALCWVGGASAYLWAYLGIQSLDALGRYSFGQLTGLSVFALLPALIFIIAGMMAREIVRSSANTRRVELAIRKLAEPAQYARHEVQTLSDAVSGEVERINSALESALARLAAMEEVISHHAESLEQSATDARDRTEHLLKGLRTERLRLGEVSESLDDKAALIAAAISDQSKMVAAAAELAASQASDSERRIRASVEDLNSAGSAVTERSDAAALVISERTTHLRELSDGLKERSENLDAAYVKHRQRLADAGEALRKEQEKIAAALDFHKAELEVMASTARDGADALNSAASNGAVAFREAVEAAIERADGMAGRVRAETESAAQEHESALARLIASAQEAKSVSDAAIDAIEAQADIVASKVEQTNEAAYEAARRSDEAFELRLAEADKLTKRASVAADEAADSVRRRLESVLATARSETQTVERHIDAMTERLAEMPGMARDRAQEAADTLRRGLEGLNAAAMAAAEEAQEIDAAFQARIRQNYELLSDFMLRMGSVAGGRRAPDLGTNELPDPLAGRKSRRSASEPAQPTDTDSDAVSDDDDMKRPLGHSEASTQPRADNAVGFPERGGRRSSGASSEPGWRWKDLLSSMPDEDDAPAPKRGRRAPKDEDGSGDS
ncbi:coiled-coil domain-containing protein [Maricaulis maris]|uniref:Uncharacterized protein n=1 Tax=Maricaulis maris TaxID=74318 RepID=A0A495DD36_9PROT|nr:hypothetical protein [Maricaulis maris]RKR00209.1 hypothetical protein C7435_1410 [Maricaulis maris]